MVERTEITQICPVCHGNGYLRDEVQGIIQCSECQSSGEVKVIKSREKYNPYSEMPPLKRRLKQIRKFHRLNLLVT